MHPCRTLRRGQQPRLAPGGVRARPRGASQTGTPPLSTPVICASSHPRHPRCVCGKARPGISDVLTDPAQVRDCAVGAEKKSPWRRMLGHHATLRAPRDPGACILQVTNFTWCSAVTRSATADSARILGSKTLCAPGIRASCLTLPFCRQAEVAAACGEAGAADELELSIAALPLRVRL